MLPYEHTAPSHLTLSMPYPTPPYPTIPYPTLPYPTLPYPTLPYPILPHPTLPYPILSYPASASPPFHFLTRPPFSPLFHRRRELSTAVCDSLLCVLSKGIPLRIAISWTGTSTEEAGLAVNKLAVTGRGKEGASWNKSDQLFRCVCSYSCVIVVVIVMQGGFVRMSRIKVICVVDMRYSPPLPLPLSLLLPLFSSNPYSRGGISSVSAVVKFLTYPNCC